MKHTLFLCVVLLLIFSSCKKADPGYNVNVHAPLSVEFDNIAGVSDLQLNTAAYTNAAGESFTVSKLKYFVSNFRLTAIDGSEYIVPRDSCYFLIDEADEETHEPVLNLPEGEYRSISFILGIDSLRSTLGPDHSGDVLDTSGISSGMYWDISKGYTFFDMDGYSAASLTGKFKYNIGGYGGSGINNLKTITLDLIERGTPKVKAGKQTNIHLMVDVLKVFNGAGNISIAQNSTVLFDPFSTTIANNYSNMIRHDHTEN